MVSLAGRVEPRRSQSLTPHGWRYCAVDDKRLICVVLSPAETGKPGEGRTGPEHGRCCREHTFGPILRRTAGCSAGVGRASATLGRQSRSLSTRAVQGCSGREPDPCHSCRTKCTRARSRPGVSRATTHRPATLFNSVLGCSRQKPRSLTQPSSTRSRPQRQPRPPHDSAERH